MNKRISAASLGLVLFAVACLAVRGQVRVPNANDTRPGGQLLFYYDVVNYDVVYLTMTNTGPSTVPIHIQLFDANCEELFNFKVNLPAGCLKIYDMGRFDLGSGSTVDLHGRKGFLVATPSSPSLGSAAIAYNHLAGNTVHANIARQNSFGLNAVARLAVNNLGVPLPDLSGPMDGATQLFQTIQPSKLYFDGAFALNSVTDSRMILFSFQDNYGPNFYSLSTAEVQVRGFAITSDCQRLSVPDNTFSCLLDVPLQSYLSGAVIPLLNNAGGLELSATLGSFQSLVGISSQTFGPYTTNRYMWGK